MGDRDKAIILWIAGFAGVVLLYSAYKGRTPITTITGSLSANDSSAGAGGSSGSSGGVATGGTALASPSTALTANPDGYVYDGNGNVVGDIPPAYSANPASYIPHTP